MELWIRSQDKRELQKADDIYISTLEDKTVKTFDGSIEINLGTYKTKERALEVLDEIQAYLMSNSPKSNVYNMPEE